MIKNVADFETAKTLFEKGFPQPTPEAGQFWWHKNPRTKALTLEIVQFVETDEVVWKDDKPRYYMIWIGDEDTGGVWFAGLHDKEGFYFAPTDTDIRLEMPQSITVQGFDLKWSAGLLLAGQMMKEVWGCETPTEAAAKLWIKLAPIFTPH